MMYRNKGVSFCETVPLIAAYVYAQKHSNICVTQPLTQFPKCVFYAFVRVSLLGYTIVCTHVIFVSIGAIFFSRDIFRIVGEFPRIDRNFLLKCPIQIVHRLGIFQENKKFSQKGHFPVARNFPRIDWKIKSE